MFFFRSTSRLPGAEHSDPLCESSHPPHAGASCFVGNFNVVVDGIVLRPVFFPDLP